ncbi:FRG domain-containing protein [Sphingobacterium sp. WOUb80]|uniref:FRG domain-containing protein n=1 Tax=Sphingobacterium sp. WOUb80 TaxID=3234028 RepID=UPI003CF4FD77
MRRIHGKLPPELLEHTTPKTVGKDSGFKISSFRELVEQIAKLSYLNKDYLLFFRGQKSDYRNSNNNSTFYPTIYRSNYLSQPELDFRFEKLSSASKILVELLKQNNISGVSEIERKKYIQWSILQHYEVTETPFIDVTQSLRVACSFAQLDNDQPNAFIYVFGLPYYSNRISINSEHDLINIRLLSISPPQALRPYFQEGYLVGTDDVFNDYLNKSELDLNNRLIAKYEIPNNDDFWGIHFNRIPKSALYPDNDIIHSICQEITSEIKVELNSSNIGNYIKLWTDLEQIIINKAKRYFPETHTLTNAIYVLLKYDEENSHIYSEINYLRQFRNKLVHKPTSVSNDETIRMTENLKNVLNMLG